MNFLLILKLTYQNNYYEEMNFLKLNLFSFHFFSNSQWLINGILIFGIKSFKLKCSFSCLNAGYDNPPALHEFDSPSINSLRYSIYELGQFMGL